jgi:iron complex outermembrane receptor protein
VNLTGRSLPYQPEFTLGAGLEHRFDTGIGSFTPRVDVAYMSDQSTKVFEVPVQDDLEERTVVNAQIAYRTGPWSATLFSTNVLDEEYVVAKVQGSGGLRVAGLPRQVGLRIQREF